VKSRSSSRHEHIMDQQRRARHSRLLHRRVSLARRKGCIMRARIEAVVRSAGHVIAGTICGPDHRTPIGSAGSTTQKISLSARTCGSACGENCKHFFADLTIVELRECLGGPFNVAMQGLAQGAGAGVEEMVPYSHSWLTILSFMTLGGCEYSPCFGRCIQHF